MKFVSESESSRLNGVAEIEKINIQIYIESNKETYPQHR